MNTKILILDFEEQENGNFTVDIAPEMLWKFIKIFQKWLISEDIRLEVRVN